MTAPSLRTPDDLRRAVGLDLSDQQVAAITAPLEPALIVAGAGTGKTTAMAARVVWLVGSGQVAPDRVLGLTFTRKAAAELGHRITELLERAGLTAPPGRRSDGEGETASPTVLTYDAYAAALIGEHGLRIGLEPDVRVITDATRFQLAADVVREHEGAIDHLTSWLPMVVTDLLALDARLNEHLVATERVRDWQLREAAYWEQAKQTKDVRGVLEVFAKRDELLTLIEAFRVRKTERGLVDFAQQMASAARLAVERPEVGVAERERFTAVLLDEYQDTSVAQARLLRALFSGPPGSAGCGHPVTAVGDPCQAIYGWRGASVGNIARFAAEFPRHGPADEGATAARVFPLSVNRRSQRRILSTANRVATPLYAAFPGAEPLRPADGAGDGAVSMALLETSADELAFVAAEVSRRHEAGTPWAEIAVLARDNKMIAGLHGALVDAGVPVEVVGLSGLLQLPEVIDVVSTLELLSDVTANAALLALLAGPRWAIGTRDLALLGARARMLSRGETGERITPEDVTDALAEAVGGTDPADLVSLSEALSDPGGLSYSESARERFRLLDRELAELRRHVGEPLLDLVRRVVEASGLEVELASSGLPTAETRRHTLATFLDAVSGFAGVDADASLAGLLAYLEAEDEYGNSLPLALPSTPDSVRLLTAHRAKGLEWDVVFVPGMASGVFCAAKAPPRWTSVVQALPTPLRDDAADEPALLERSTKGLAEFGRRCQEAAHDEERRLAYVALTRPRRELVVSAHWWGPAQKRPRGPSMLADDVRGAIEALGVRVEPDEPAPPKGATNPANATERPVPWPAQPHADEIARREQAADLVVQAQAAGWVEAAAAADSRLLLDEQATVAEWDLEIAALLDEAHASRADEIAVPLPPSLSTTTLLRIAEDPDAVARSLARPMPRRPSRAARFGTRFHAWVEAHVGRPLLLDPDDLPGRADLDISGDEELRALVAAFRAGPYADRPPVEVEAPFSLVLSGRVVRGRIDAVYAEGSGFEVVDWKTNRAATADPLQLAVYRIAWAELTGCPLDDVSAAFYYVRSGEIVRPADLPDRAQLELLLAGG